MNDQTKGVASHSAILERAGSAAGHGYASPSTERDLVNVIEFPRRDQDAADSAPLGLPALAGETVLLVESDAAAALALRAAVERAGAEVMWVRTAAEAVPRIARFDFSVAVVEWRSDTSEHRTLAKRLRKDKVRLLHRADAPPEGKDAAWGLPFLRSSAPPREVVAALARLTAAASKDRPARRWAESWDVGPLA